MATSTSNSMPEDQVDTLMKQVADENGLELQSNLDGIGVGHKNLNEKKTVVRAVVSSVCFV